MCLPYEYSSCSDGEYFFLSKKNDSVVNIKPDKLAKKYIEQLYKNDGKVDAKTKAELHRSFYDPLKEAIQEGLGQTITSIEYGTPDYDMLKNLNTNVSVFSMFKSEALVKNASNLLTDQDGNLRSRLDFYKEALKLDATYRKRYADVEYDTAVRQSRMASIWQKAQDTKNIYPNFEYVRSRSAKPRADHEALVGTVLPIDDPWWDGHMPQLGYGCKCSVKVTDADVTDIPRKAVKPDKGFDFNPGKTGQCFDIKNSEYIKSVPPKDQPALIKAAEKIANNELLKNAGYTTLPGSKKAGNIEVHPLSYGNADFKQNLSFARELSKQKHDVRILPDLRDKELRKQLLPDKGIKGMRNPDYIIDGKMVTDLKEVKGSSKNSISHAISTAKAQCDNVILEFGESTSFTRQEVIDHITRKMKQKEMDGFGEVWVNYNGEWLYNPHKK